MHLVFFDMEGPLSIQDNAYELMKLFPNGGRVFEVISRYDDILTLEGREGYEPGDTLALIVPFLVCHGISRKDVEQLAQKAAIVNGAIDLISYLHHWEVFCISTSYEPYARHIIKRVGIVPDHLACTTYAIERYQEQAEECDFDLILEAEKEILSMTPDDEAVIKKRLDRLFWQQLPATSLGLALQDVKPVGGRRKVAALENFALASGEPLKGVVAVGDSITDARMLEAVNKAGGLAIAFNANEYCLPYATIGLASTNIGDLKTVFNAWVEGGREAVKQVVTKNETPGGTGTRKQFHWLDGAKDIMTPLKIHKRIRRIVRQEAGILG